MNKLHAGQEYDELPIYGEINIGDKKISYNTNSAPLDEQIRTFKIEGLHLASPAEIMYFISNIKYNPVYDEQITSSRTSMDFVYLPKQRTVALVKENIISTAYGMHNLVNAHKKGRRFIIVPNNNRKEYNWFTDLLNDLKKDNLVYLLKPESVEISPDELDEPLFEFIFNDRNLKNDSKKIKKFMEKNDVFFSLYINIPKQFKDQPGISLNITKLSFSNGLYLNAYDSILQQNSIEAFGMNITSSFRGYLKNLLHLS